MPKRISSVLALGSSDHPDIASHLKDLKILVVEHLEKTLLEGRLNKWMIQGLVSAVDKALQQEQTPTINSRLAEFYVLFQQRGGPSKYGQEGSEELRLSSRRNSLGSRSPSSSRIVFMLRPTGLYIIKW